MSQQNTQRAADVPTVKPTPGPWALALFTKNKDGFPDSLAVAPAKLVDARKHGNAICILSAVEKVTPQDEANAYLIAAAPDLLAVLKSVEWSGLTDAEEGGLSDACPCCDAEEGDGHHDGCKLAAALAKAEGRAEQ